MKNKVKKELDAKNLRQIELLKKHFTIDEENKTICLDFFYESIDDIFRDNINHTHVPIINHEIIDDIYYYFDRVPSEYKFVINYKINNYDDFTPKDAIESFTDELELDYYLSFKRTNKVCLVTSVLSIFGCFLITLSVVLTNFSLLDGISGQIIGYIIDAGASGFIWEALALIFLNSDDDSKNAKYFMDILHSISFYDSNGEKMVEYKKEEITQNWVSDTKLERRANKSYLLTGTCLIIIGVIGIVTFFVSMSNIKEKLCLYYFIVHTVLSFVETFTGLCCITSFLNKTILPKFLIPSMIILTILLLGDIICFIIFAQQTDTILKSVLISSIISLVSILFLVIILFLAYKEKKKNKK